MYCWYTRSSHRKSREALQGFSASSLLKLFGSYQRYTQEHLFEQILIDLSKVYVGGGVYRAPKCWLPQHYVGSRPTRKYEIGRDAYSEIESPPG